tara:strand:+ start:980 stop:2179 length:1200 start_codon:yes stop_codon:yes gene_type:complete
MRKGINLIPSSALVLLSIALLLPPLVLNIWRAYSNVSSWQITEWLISYDGGFVRRGIGGEIVKTLSVVFELSPSLTIIILSIFSWLLLVFLVLRVSRGLLPSYIVLSPVFLGMPIYSDFVIRKDVLGLLVLAFSFLVIRNWDGIKKYIAVTTLLVFGVLNHESIIFYGFPIIILAEISVNKNVDWKRNLVPHIPLLLVGLAVVINKGTVETALHITSFWNSFFTEKYPRFCCYAENPAAIDAIGWSTQRGLSLSLSLLSEFVNGFIYVPLAWILTIFICLQFGRWSLKKAAARQFSKIFLIQLFFVSPLFLLGWDFGRWIFFVTVSSLLWVSCFREVEISNKYLDYLDRIEYLGQQFNQKELGFFGLIVGVPVCCWSASSVILSTPAGNTLYILYKLIQ